MERLKHIWQNSKIIILIIAAFVMLIILIAVINLFLGRETGIVNEESIEEESSLGATDWEEVEEVLTDYTETNDLEIRDGTYQEEEINNEKVVSFIADSDERQVSVEVTYYPDDETGTPAVINCVEPSLSKYPDVACDGVNGQSTMDVVLGDDLPLYIKLNNGVTIVATKGYYETSQFLKLEGQFCGSDSLESEAISKAKKLIAKSYDINADMFDYQTSDLCSDDGE